MHGLFWETTSGYVVFRASWFDSGYMLLPVYGFFWGVSVFSAKLGPQWYMLCVSHGVCLLVTMHVALCSFLSSSGHRCLSSWLVWTRRSGSWRRAENLTFPSCCRGSSPRSLRPKRFPSLRVDKVVDAPLYAGRADYPCRGTEADSHGLVDHGDSPALHR